MSQIFDEIVQELKKSRGEGAPIPLTRVQEWMEIVNDADALGAAYVFLSKAEHVNRVTPPLSFDPVFSFMLRYYEFCLTSNPESKWANNSYSAGWDLVGWFVSMWDKKRDRKYFEAVKSMMEKLYLPGNTELKKCIEHAIVEHLFERKPIREFFAGWRETPELRPAYEEGMRWIRGGGTSPLTKSQQQ